MFPIFILIIGVLLIVYGYAFMKKENEMDVSKNSFDLVLRNNKDEMNDYKMEIGLLRKDIGESLTELQEDIIEIRKELNIIKGKNKLNENIDKDVSNEERNMAQKAKAIKELLDLDVSDYDICQRLSVSKGEVLLVKGLYK